MRRKRIMRRIGSILLVVGAGALGIILGAALYFFAPDLIPLPPTRTPTAPPPVTLAPTATAPPAWIVTFEHRFSPGQLDSGRTGYLISVDCPPGGVAGTWQSEVVVSGAAQIRRQRVYLRATGVYDSPTDGTTVTAIHPEQVLGAAATVQFASRELAEAARESCSSTVSLAGLPPEPMTPGIPREVQGG